jgi:hypothetical protein
VSDSSDELKSKIASISKIVKLVMDTLAAEIDEKQRDANSDAGKCYDSYKFISEMFGGDAISEKVGAFFGELRNSGPGEIDRKIEEFEKATGINALGSVDLLCTSVETIIKKMMPKVDKDAAEDILRDMFSGKPQ